MEKKNRTPRDLFRAFSLLISVCLFSGSVLLTPQAATSAQATTVRLPKTQGTVRVTDSAGKAMHIVDNMRLTNGNHTVTAEQSYAWFNLDDVKALKEDAVSEVEVRKEGKKLEVLLDSGNLFFNVTEPL